MTAGFVVSAVGVGVVGSGGTGSADDLFSALNNLFQVPTMFPQYQQPQAGAVEAQEPRRTARLAHRRGGDTAKAASLRQAKPVRLGRASMCVRLCDGFAFPVGTYHGEEDRPSHEATCQAECPGATTSLYVLPTGSDQIGDAIEVKSGRTYSQIPSAFHYTTFLEQSCSCHPHDGSRTASLLRDFTLRRGDAVMTATGFRVFHGGEHFPHRQADFVALAQSRDVHDNRRATFRAIERASIGKPPTVALGRPATPSHDAVSTKGAVPPYEKQASLQP